MGFYEAELHHLYDGGIQSEEPETCVQCGEETNEDAVEAGGEIYCRACYNRELMRWRRIVDGAFIYCDEPLEKKALAEVLTDFIEEELED